MKSPFFYAKILLFGEYGVIENGKGLTLPFNSYKGLLNYNSVTEADNNSNQLLIKYFAYLKQNLTDILDISKLESDLDKGLSFNSTIPQSYGIGSSGALVAALYDAYALDKIDLTNDFRKDKVEKLKSDFSRMESYFHGKSSGIDPLICYLNIPLLIEPNIGISKIGLPTEQNGQGAIFLLNSGEPGETEPMVNIFFEKLKNQGFRNTLKKEFIKYNNSCIQAFVGGDYKALITEIKKLSGWALEHFQPMIPAKVLSLWKKGIEDNLFYLKLCGSGGGGYVLGFTADFNEASKHLEGFQTEVIMRI